MLESIFYTETAEITMRNCITSLVVAIILGLVISFIHKLTTKTTRNFLLTLTILPVLVGVVIMLVNGNLGTSFAVAGAFSLIRFRSMPGNSKEIITVFWAMAVGLACGMGYIVYAIVLTIIVGIVIILINKVLSNFEDLRGRKLKIVIPENLDYSEIFNDLFEKYTQKSELRKVKTTNMGSTFELSYYISLKNDINEKSFLDEIRIRNANMLVMLEREELSEVEL